MTRQDIVSFEIATLLQEVPFITPTIKYYNIYNKQIFTTNLYIHSEAVHAPTYGEVIDWIKLYTNKDVELNEESIKSALLTI
jgi:hypothetical protein